MNSILIAYYSRSGENYWNGQIKSLAKGNTEIVAEMIQKSVGGTLFKIETVKTYPLDYYECIREAKQELKSDARLELKYYPSDLNMYDVIFLGYPNWWGTMPMAVCTFLEHYDLSGKKIIPFCTHEGGKLGHSEKDLKKICKNSVVLGGLAVHGAEAAESEA